MFLLLGFGNRTSLNTFLNISSKIKSGKFWPNPVRAEAADAVDDGMLAATQRLNFTELTTNRSEKVDVEDTKATRSEFFL